MKPSFQLLWKNYPRAGEVSRAQLFSEIGWDSLADDPAYANTCAIRMSCALQKSGVSIESSAGMKGLKGAMKNKAIEVRQDKLSEQLKLLWGKPVVLPQTDVENSMGEKDGVISFSGFPVIWSGAHLEATSISSMVKAMARCRSSFSGKERSMCRASVAAVVTGMPERSGFGNSASAPIQGGCLGASCRGPRACRRGCLAPRDR